MPALGPELGCKHLESLWGGMWAPALGLSPQLPEHGQELPPTLAAQPVGGPGRSALHVPTLWQDWHPAGTLSLDIPLHLANWRIGRSSQVEARRRSYKGRNTATLPPETQPRLREEVPFTVGSRTDAPWAHAQEASSPDLATVRRA